MSNNENRQFDLEPLKKRESIFGSIARFVIGAMLLITAIGITAGFLVYREQSGGNPTPTVAPTETAFPTVEPTPTDIPATPTPMPTATTDAKPPEEIVPTSTLIPTMAVLEDTTLLDSVKMGDDIWYDFYDDGTLVVRGTGKTKEVDAEFKTVYEPQSTVLVQINEDDFNNIVSKYGPTVTCIVVSEGVTELEDWSLSGFFFTKKVSLPTTLRHLGYASLFKTIDESVEIVGIRSDMTFEKYALGSIYMNATSEFEPYTVAPTPKPLPTATPLPNPDKPKKYATKQMGDSVTFEFWDNGYLYVKGTGATWDKEWNFCEFREEPYCNTHIIVVEEGVTYLGNHCFAWLTPETMYFPNTLSSIGNVGAWTTIHGVNEGKSYVATGGYGYNFFKYFEDKELAKKQGFELIFE